MAGSVENPIDYPQLLLFAIEQILYSNLESSTVYATGFASMQTTTAGYLQGPPLLVQVVAFAEIIQPFKPRGIKFKLSDGEKCIDAFTNVPLSSDSDKILEFDNLKLGCKVGRMFML